MKADPSNPEPRLDENDPVWRLLAESPRPEPDAWFATRTLARCRREGIDAKSTMISALRVWRWAFGGVFGLSLALVLGVTQLHVPPTQADQRKNVQDAFAYMASLNSDPDSTPTPSWQDSSL